jgi:hypothetical protein
MSDYGQVSTDIQRITKKVIRLMSGTGAEILSANPERKFLCISSNSPQINLTSNPYVGIFLGVSEDGVGVNITTPGGILIVPALVVNITGTDYYSTYPPFILQGDVPRQSVYLKNFTDVNIWFQIIEY